MTEYKIEGIRIFSKAIQKDFVSWKNVWLFIKVLIAMEALYYTNGMPLMALVVAVFLVWLISITQTL